MYNNNAVGVIIPAGGSSERMGTGIRKQFLEIAGKPIWIHTVEKFQQCSAIDAMVIAAPSASIKEMENVVRSMSFHKVRGIVEGGLKRQDSVRLAIEVMKTVAPDLILVHDAVRPMVSSGLITEVVAASERYGAVIPAVHPKDTVKLSDGDSFVRATSDRENLWLVQTPQGFRAEVLYRAYERAEKEGFLGTDEAGLVERSGVRVKIIEGSRENVKITTPEDLSYAEFLLGK